MDKYTRLFEGVISALLIILVFSMPILLFLVLAMTVFKQGE